MNRFTKLTFLGLFLTLIITSCSIEKRDFRPGYFIQWHKNYHSSNTNKTTRKNISFKYKTNKENYSNGFGS